MPGRRQTVTTSRRAIRVVAGVFTDGDRLLACRRAPLKTAAGQWEFPGGKIEPGESPEEALVRELLEELNVAVSVGPLIDRSTTRVGGLEIDLACYEVSALSEAPSTSTDHDELRWISVPELPGLAWATPDLPTVSALKRRAAQ